MRILWVMAGVGMLFALPLEAADPAVGTPVRAVWKEQRMDYLGPRLSLVFSSPQLPDASVNPLHKGDLLPVDARYESFVLTSDAFRILRAIRTP